MQLTALLTALEKLILALRKTGNGSADFFSTKLAELTTNTTGAIVDEALERLSTCRAMAQYGDFSFEQEALLEAVVNAAADCLAKRP